MAEVELGRENEGTHLHHSYCKIKDWNHREVMLMFTYWSDWGTRWMTTLLLDWFSIFLGRTSLVRHLFFHFFGSYFFGTPFFLSSPLWVMLLWHVIFPLFFQMERDYQSKILEHLFCRMNKYLCTRTESEN